MFTTAIAHGLPFPGPSDGIVVCAENVPLGRANVLIVQTFLNDRGELDWLFYSHSSDLEQDRMVPLALDALLHLDPTLREVADLPADWVASSRPESREGLKTRCETKIGADGISRAW